jgi:hypothetical protein
MANSLTEWLGALVAQEIESAVAWKRSLDTKNTKPDPDTPHSDDGSNFRTFVESPPLSDDCKLQLLAVMSTTQPVSVLLSDGKCSIRATLSQTALHTLETEMDGKLEVGMKGDVISPTLMTLISTNYGMPESNVQLDIEELKYHFTLRKTFGNPMSIEKDGRVARSIKFIEVYRAQQYADNLEDEEPSSQGAIAEYQDQSLQTQVVQTQRLKRKRQPVPSLEEDGFEVHGGVNLDRPEALKTIPRKAPRQHATVSDDTLRILGLMGGPRAPVNNMHGPLPFMPVGTNPGDVVEQVSDPGRSRLRTPENATTMTNTSGISKPLKDEAIPVHASSSSQLHDKEQNTTTANTTSQPREIEETVTTASVTSQPRENKQTTTMAKGHSQSNQADHVATLTDSTSQSRMVDRVPYGRRRIPEKQQRLLDRKDSWFPPLPGFKLPQPNVPVDLLQAWNEQVMRETSKTVEQPAHAGASRAERDVSPNRSGQMSISSSDDDDDEQFDESQWPASQTPTPRKQLLPPDSTIGIRSSAQSSFIPGRLPYRSPGKPAAKKTPNVGNPVTRKMSSVNNTPLGSRYQTPASSQGRNARLPLASMDSTSPRSQYTTPAQSPIRANRPPSASIHSTTSPTHIAQSPLAKRPTSTSYSSAHDSPSRLLPPITQQSATQTPLKHPLPPKPAKSLDSPETVIKATQFSTTGDDMEMDVPRPLTDPAELQRQKRSAFMKNAQRKDWCGDSTAYAVYRH